MTILQSLFLGLVQGIAEFLPISSSGHLSVFQNLFGLNAAGEDQLLFDVLLHLGTLVAVVVVYWNEIVTIVKECVELVRGIGHPVPGEKKRLKGVRLLLMIIFATLPLILVLPIHDSVEKLYYSTAFIGIAFLATGGMLYCADRMPRGSRTERNMRVTDALLIGLCQALATMPGLSRSGTTITAGLATGLRRDFAVKYSFLLSLPAVLGANILAFAKAIKNGVDWSCLPAYLVGTAVAILAGIASISLLKRIADKGKFGGFAYYCWVVGVLSIILTVIF